MGKRDKNGNIVWMSPGIMYPLMSAMSEFVMQGENGEWQINKPKQFKPSQMIDKTLPLNLRQTGRLLDTDRVPRVKETLLGPTVLGQEVFLDNKWPNH